MRISSSQIEFDKMEESSIPHQNGGPPPASLINNKQNDDNSQRTQYTIPGILHFIQHEWARFELERSQWEVDRAELQVQYLSISYFIFAFTFGESLHFYSLFHFNYHFITSKSILLYYFQQKPYSSIHFFSYYNNKLPSFSCLFHLIITFTSISNIFMSPTLIFY